MLVMWGGRGNGVDLLISMYKKLILTGMLKKPLLIRTSCNSEGMLLVSCKCFNVKKILYTNELVGSKSKTSIFVSVK